MQEWTSNAMLYSLRLALMALGGYINGHSKASSNEDSLRSKVHHSSAVSSHTSSTLYGRLRQQPRATFAFPDAHELKSQLFSPVKVHNGTSSSASALPPDHPKDTSHTTTAVLTASNLHVASDALAAPPPPPTSGSLSSSNASTTDRKRLTREQQPSWLDVPCMKLTRMEESEGIWVSSIAILADLCNIPSLPLIHRAIYCLEVLISSGNVANLPMAVWYKALDELLSKMPLNLVMTTSKLQPGLAPTEIHETCFRCCNLIFHLIVMHIRELRKGEHFPAMFIRSISAMTANASVSAKGYSTYTEMVSMIIALLRLLRLPELQPLPVETKQTEVRTVQEKESSQDSQESPAPGGFLGVLHWMIAPAPQPPPKATSNVEKVVIAPSVSTGPAKLTYNPDEGPVRLTTLDHDGTLFLLTWKAVTSVYSHLPTIINSWDPQYCKSIMQSIELIEAIKVRGETDAPFLSMSAQEERIQSGVSPAVVTPQNETVVPAERAIIAAPPVHPVMKSHPLIAVPEMTPAEPARVGTTTIPLVRAQSEKGPDTQAHSSINTVPTSDLLVAPLSIKHPSKITPESPQATSNRKTNNLDLKTGKQFARPPSKASNPLSPIQIV